MKSICIFLVTALCAHGAVSDPGEAAIEFMEKVREGNLDLSPGADTAITPQTADRKKEQIAKRYKRIAKDLGKDSIEVGAVKTDEDFAAVLIQKVSAFDPSGLQIFPIALVKRDSKWFAAPVPASFENAGVGFALPLKIRLEALEKWMLREQVLEMEKLRERASGQLRREIQTRLPLAEMRGMDASLLAQRFLTACESRDLQSLLGLFGGLADELPDDWSLRLKATRLAINEEIDRKRAWQLLLSPRVVRVVVNENFDGPEGIFSIACLDPGLNDSRTSLPRIEFIHFEFSRDDSLVWKIDPPPSLLTGDEEVNDAHDEDLDEDLIAEFLQQWQLLHPAAPQASPEAAQNAFINALQQKNLNSFLQLILPNDDPQVASKALALGAKLWWNFHAPGAVKIALPLRFQQREDHMLAVFQFFSTRDPDRLDSQNIYFEKSTAGWFWMPEINEATRKIFENEPPEKEEPSLAEWQDKLLTESILLEGIPELPAPGAREAEAIFAAWQQATAAGDVRAALKLTARFNDPRGNSAFLRNLGHEITGARRSGAITTYLSSHVGSVFTGMGAKIEYDGKSVFPLYPVIQTPQGPRILIEIDLFEFRSQGLLNRIALERLGKLGSKPAAEDLGKLFEQFRAGVAASLNPESR